MSENNNNIVIIVASVLGGLLFLYILIDRKRIGRVLSGICKSSGCCNSK